MSILISPSDNRGWGRMRYGLRGVGYHRPLTLRSFLGLGHRHRRVHGGARTSTRLVAVRTTNRRRRRRYHHIL